MLEKIAWNTFKNTGNIDTFLEFRQIKQLENFEKIEEANKNGYNKNEWNSTLGK